MDTILRNFQRTSNVMEYDYGYSDKELIDFTNEDMWYPHEQGELFEGY